MCEWADAVALQIVTLRRQLYLHICTFVSTAS